METIALLSMLRAVLLNIQKYWRMLETIWKPAFWYFGDLFHSFPKPTLRLTLVRSHKTTVQSNYTWGIGGAAEAQGLLCQEAVGRWSDWPSVLGQEWWPRESLGGSIGQCGRSYFWKPRKWLGDVLVDLNLVPIFRLSVERTELPQGMKWRPCWKN